MKQFTFKDGFKCVASTRKEAIKIHKVTARPHRPYASVPTSFIKKLIDLGFDDEDNDVKLDREQKNFNYVQILNPSRSKCVGIVQKNLGNNFILFSQDEDDNESTIKSFNTIDEAVRFLEKPDVMLKLKRWLMSNKNENLKEDLVITASSVKKAIQKHKIVASMKDYERKNLNKCLKLLEEQTELCGTRFYFSVDGEKEIVNVYLKPDKKNVYIEVNVAGENTAMAMYEIWKKIHLKF